MGDKPQRGPAKTTYDVSIAGISLKLKSSHDQEMVDELIRFVDHKVREALPLTKSGSVQTAALLACLNVAEEMVLLKQKARDELTKFEKKAQKVISGLESSRIPKAGLDH